MPEPIRPVVLEQIRERARIGTVRRAMDDRVLLLAELDRLVGLLEQAGQTIGEQFGAVLNPSPYDPALRGYATRPQYGRPQHSALAEQSAACPAVGFCEEVVSWPTLSDPFPESSYVDSDGVGRRSLSCDLEAPHDGVMHHDPSGTKWAVS